MIIDYREAEDEYDNRKPSDRCGHARQALSVYEASDKYGKEERADDDED